MAGIQSLAVSVAVVAGGIWSLFTFRTLSAKRKALAELADLEAKVKRQGVVNLSISVSQLLLTPARDLALSIDVIATNVGSRNVLVRFDDDSIVATECVPSGDSVLPISATYVRYDFESGPEKATTGDLVIRVGKTWHLPFIARVPRPGLYNVLVQAILSSTEAAIAAETGLTAPADSVAWSDSTFVVIHPIAESGAVLSSPPLVLALMQPLLTVVERTAARAWRLYTDDDFRSGDTYLVAALNALADARVEILYGDAGRRRAAISALSEWGDIIALEFPPALFEAIDIEELRHELSLLREPAA